jgi:subtilisin-like proprotein convertase family protein
VINNAAAGTQAWVTNLTGDYNASEQSYVQKFFDFSSLTADPIIELEVWWESEEGFDGAKLQTTTDGGTTWTTLGAYGDPHNWYTRSDIGSLNWLDNQHGWDGRNGAGSGGWVTARHTLTGLAGEAAAGLRIAFGSDTDIHDNGFAFDNVRILRSSELIFTPAPNANGTPYATFQFKVRDAGGAVSTANHTMTVDVSAVADRPTSAAASVSTPEDTAYTFETSDIPFSDPDGDDLGAIQVIGLESVGALTYAGQPVSLNGVYADLTQLVYTPLDNGNGSPYDNFIFKVVDTTGLTSTVTYNMEINVTAVDDAPLGANDTIAATEDITYTFDSGDFTFSDTDGHPLALIVIQTTETAGDLECSGSDVDILDTCPPANLRFIPAADANGSPYASFGFKVQDSSGQNSVASYTLTINVAAAADTPVGGDGQVSLDPNATYTFKTADFPYSDADGEAFAGISFVSTVVSGTLTCNSTPVIGGSLCTAVTQLEFTPDANEAGEPYETYTFQVRDATGALSTPTYTMTINVQPGNPPTGGNSGVTTSEDTSYTFAETDFPYSDPEGDDFDGIRFSTVESAGELHCNGAEVLVGSWCKNVTQLTFLPASGANGAPYANFTYRLRDASNFLSDATYTLQITVTATNDTPVIHSSPVVTATEDVSYSYALVSSDADLGDTLTISTTGTLPAWLTLTDHTNGTATLSGTPNNDQIGRYALNLEVQDSAGARASQDFFLTVVNVNDAPVFTSTAVVTATENGFYAYNIVTTDVDAFEAVTITSAAPLPVWLTLGDRGDGTATLTGTPANGDVGASGISLLVTDAASASAQQDFTLTVENVNTAPALTSVPVATVDQADTYNYHLTAADNDPGELLSFRLVSGPGWLTLTNNGNATADLDGAPTFNEAGSYAVTIEVSDRATLTDTQSYTLTVLNAAPVAADDYATTPLDTLVEFDVRANDSDPDGNAITVIAVAPPFTGTTDLLDTARVRYTPPSNFTGPVAFTYTVSDGKNSSHGYAFVEIYNNPPSGADDTGETISGARVAVDVLNNDFDPDGEALIVSAIDPLSINGTALIAADGKSLTYLAPAAFVGDEVFNYTLQVAGDASQTATAGVTVTVHDVSSINSDVSISRSSTPLTFPEGEARAISTDILVKNNNPTEIAAGVVVTDVITLPVLNGSASTGLGSCNLSSTGAVCDIGVIPPSQTILVHLDYTIGTAPGAAITSTVSTLSTDPTPGNNTDNTTFTVLSGRDTRAAGGLDVTANSFAYLPASGNTRGTGEIIVDEHFKLAGVDAAVEFNSGEIATLTGTLTYVVGAQDIVRGVFGVAENGDLQFTQVDEIYLNTFEGFAASSPTLTSLSLLSGKAAGTANLDIPTPAGELNLSAISLTFELTPGPYTTGQIPTFTLTYFDTAGNLLKVTDVETTLIRQGSESFLIGPGQVHLNLPGNNQTQNLGSLIVKSDGTLTGFAGALELDPVVLAVDGAQSFTLGSPELDNQGLRDQTKSYLTMDDGSQAFVSGAKITANGLNQVGKTFSVPGSFTSDVFAIGQLKARLTATATAYQFEIIGGQLRLRLPQNYRNISNFDLTPGATNADIQLAVGEAQLTLHNPYVNGETLVARSITWQLPASMGGETKTFNQSVSISSPDLSSLPFPAQITVGEEADALDADVDTVSIRATNGAYQIDLGIKVHLDLEGTPAEGLAGTLNAGPEGPEINIEPFTFTVGGYEIDVDGGASIDMTEFVLIIEEAAVAVNEVAEHNKISMILEHIGVDKDTIQIAEGKARFKIPPICMGKPKFNQFGQLECSGLMIKDVQADLVQNNDGSYDISGQGALAWPDEGTPLPTGCTGIEAAITVSYNPNTGQQIYTMTPSKPGGTIRLVDSDGNSTTAPLTPDGIGTMLDLSNGIPIGSNTGAYLTQAYFALDGCEIPLAQPTGPIFLSKAGGGFEIDDGGVIIRLTAGFDIKNKPTPTAQVIAPLRINADAYYFLPKRWITFEGGCMDDYSIDPWEAEQELDENFSDVEIELARSEDCYGTYKFTRLEAESSPGAGNGSIGILVSGTGSAGAPASVQITTRFDKYPLAYRLDGEFLFMEEFSFATGTLEADPRGIRLVLENSEEISEFFNLEFSGGVSTWVDESNEFYLTGFLKASFEFTLEMLWDVLPDRGMEFDAALEFGHFYYEDDKIFGIKGDATGSAVITPEVCGEVCAFGYCHEECTPEWSKSFDIAFFLDTDFNLATGSDIDDYELAERYSGQGGPETARDRLPMGPNAPMAEVLKDVTIPYTATTRVILQSQPGGPTMTLEAPDASLYGHDSLPAAIAYNEAVTFISPVGQTPAANQGRGQLRVTHAVADYGAMDVYVDGQLEFASLTYTDTSAYLGLAPGTYPVEFFAAGTTTPVLAQTTADLAVGQDASVIATGQAGAMTAGAVQDDNAPRAGGRPYLRLVHVGHGLGAVDLEQRMGRQLLTNIAYQEDSDYVKLYPMGYAFNVRDNATGSILVTLENAQIENGTIYTIFVFETPSGTEAVLVADAVAPTSLQVVHVAGDQGALQVSLDGTVISTSLTLGTALSPEYLEVGQHQLVISAGLTTLVNETVDLTEAAAYQYVLEASGGSAAGQVISTTQGATYPQAAVRLFHLAPSVPTVDAVLRDIRNNEVAIASTVAFNTLSATANAPAATHTLILRAAGTTTELYQFNDVVLAAGTVATFYLYEVSGVPTLAVLTDFTMGSKTLAMYEVENAAAGDWTVHLHGEVINEADYTLAVESDVPEPALSDVHITYQGEQPYLQWRLNSPKQETAIGLFYKLGTITETEVISQNGALQVNSQPVYNGQTFTGTLTSTDSGWVAGTLQQYPLDESLLVAGSYSIYLEADDQANTVSRAVAPESLVVTHTWPTTWNANLVISDAGYREVRANWTRFDNPAVAQYTLVAQAANGGLQQAYVGSGYNPSVGLENLNPGEVYTFTVRAWDGKEDGLATVSDPILHSVPGAAFTMSGETLPAVDVGESISTVITLTTALEPYPALVGLYAGPRSDGLAMTFEPEIVQPTLAGVPVTVTLSTSQYLPGGTYTATVKAVGGGETRTLELQPTVVAPYFNLTATPGTPLEITGGGSISLTVGAARYEGHADNIWFEVQNLPLVDWSLDTDVISGTSQATLWFTDTVLAQHGTYTFTLSAEDGRTTDTVTRTLFINKPSYNLTAAQETITTTGGLAETTPVSITLGIEGGWNSPVTLMVEPRMAPPFGKVGFGTEYEAFTVVTPPDEIALQIETGPQTPLGMYIIPVIAESDGRQEQINFILDVQYVPAPEIEVLGNGARIRSGDTTPITSDGTDYGTTAAVGGAVVHTFTISNTGDADLNLTGTPTVALSTGTHFGVTSLPTPTTIATGTAVTFQVTFDPIAAGSFTDTITIENDDRDESIFTFVISGTGTAIAAFPWTEDFGTAGCTIPDGWTNDPTNTEDWLFKTVMTYGAANDHTTGLDCFTTIDDSSAHNATPANLLTPSFDLTGLPAAWLSFWWQNASGSPTTVSTLNVDIYDGSTWHEDVISLITAEDDWVLVALDLTPYIARNTQIRFEGNEHADAYVSDISLDDVKISANQPPPEIDVQGNSQSIANGDISPSGGDDTDFGNTAVNGGAVVHTFTVRNAGALDLSLTGTPAVTLTVGTHFTVTAQPVSTTLGANAATTFQITFDPTLSGEFTDTVIIASNDSDEDPYTFVIQGVGEMIYSSGAGLGAAVPDDACATYLEHTINVPDYGTIIDLNMMIDSLTHSWDSDLSIYLQGPDSTQVELSTDNGASGDNYTGTIFDDEATATIIGQSAPFTGRYQPEGNLADFDGKEIHGDWTLRICDAFSPDAGTLNEWGLAAILVPAAPEIDVTGKGISIADGDNSPSLSDDTDFGSVSELDATVVHTFTISNTGNAVLNLTGTPTVTLTTGTHFSVTQQSGGNTINTETGMTFQITFDPQSDGIFTDTVTIESNDTDEGSYTFAITGTGEKAYQVFIPLVLR